MQKKKTLKMYIGVIIFYLLITALFFYSDKILVETGTKGMGVSSDTVTYYIGETAYYRQYFTTTVDTVGIEIKFATYCQEANNGIEISVYDAQTDQLLASGSVPKEDIEDNARVKILFDDTILDEGKSYYFEINSTNVEAESNVVVWTGKTESDYVGDFLYNGSIIEDTAMCYSLVHRMSGRGIAKWIFATIIYMFVSEIFIRKLNLEKKQILVWCLNICIILAMVVFYGKVIY